MSRRRSTRLVLLGGLLVLAAAAWLLLGEDDDGGAAEGPTIERDAWRDAPRETPALAVVAPTADGPAVELPHYVRARLAGATPFQRRLSLGLVLEQLANDYAKDKLDVRQVRTALRRLRPALLHLEWRRRFEVDYLLKRARADPDDAAAAKAERTKLVDVLRTLVVPACIPERFHLVGSKVSSDPRGSDLRVRVWQAEEDLMHPAAVARAEALLDELVKASGRRVEYGYDVILSPECGAEYFRSMPRSRWWIGLYTLRDRLCFVLSKMDTWQVQLTFKHELVHAWKYGVFPDWGRRFVSEGLSEYLEHWRPGDEGLQVPVERFADNFAFVVEILRYMEARGAPVDRFPLARLVTAGPRSFYRLGWLAYAVAQACYAYVGPEVLEEALKTGKEGVLVRAFQDIAWADLLEFMGTHGRDGVADDAWFVGEAPWLDDGRLDAIPLPRHPLGWKVSSRLLDEALDRQGWDEEIDTEARVQQVLAMLRSERGLKVGGFDNSSAMDGSIEVRWSSDAVTRLSIMREAYQLLWEQGVRVGTQHTFALRDVCTQDAGAWRADAAGTKAFQARAVRTFAHEARRVRNARDRPPGTFLMLAGHHAPLRERLGMAEGEAARRERDLSAARWYEDLLRGQVPEGPILVVDLAPETSDARAIAEAMARLGGKATTVAYRKGSEIK